MLHALFCAAQHTEPGRKHLGRQGVARGIALLAAPTLLVVRRRDAVARALVQCYTY